MKFETVIGLEVHTQLKTQSKIFSGAPTTYGAEPNSQACAIDLGMPGVLPVLNREAVKLAVRFGLAINAQIASHSVFARKNYFYPDLPKGYQISQFDLPIVGKGYLDIDLENETKRIRITRAHLEEDAGKSVHDANPDYTAIDLNRAGTPLLEIVSEPDLRSAKEAVAYLKTLHHLVRYLGISDGNMQEGSFRCDVNLSLRPEGSETLGTRTELKNLNSFRFIERAILHETERQAEILRNDGTIIQETRLYDPTLDETRTMRSKEDAHDYRYFPDPDLLPVVLTDHFINEIRDQLPELPHEKRARFEKNYDLSPQDAKSLTASLEIANYFEKTLRIGETLKPKLVANWMISNIIPTFEECPIKEGQLAALLTRVSDNTISSSAGKTVLEAMWEDQDSPDRIIEKLELKQISDAGELGGIIDEIIKSNPKQVEEYRAGKDKLIAFFVGQVMKITKGKANPEQVNTLLSQKLKGSDKSSE